MVYQIFLSLQVKQSAINSDKLEYASYKLISGKSREFME